MWSFAFVILIVVHINIPQYKALDFKSMATVQVKGERKLNKINKKNLL
jgi:hypothetical protein